MVPRRRRTSRMVGVQDRKIYPMNSTVRRGQSSHVKLLSAFDM